MIYDIPKNIKVFLKNEIIRNAIQQAIDILYINDQLFDKDATYPLVNEHTKSSQVNAITDTRETLILHSLAYIIKPKYLYGIYNKNPLPRYMTACCAKVNHFE